jgi:hypothetical protein
MKTKLFILLISVFSLTNADEFGMNDYNNPPEDNFGNLMPDGINNNTPDMMESRFQEIPHEDVMPLEPQQQYEQQPPRFEEVNPEAMNHLEGDHVAPLNDFEDNEYASELFNELGFNNKETITRDQFKTFFHKMMSREHNDLDLHDFYGKVFDSYIKDIPEEIPTHDIHTYVDFDKLQSTIQHIVGQEYGSEYQQQVKAMFESEGINNNNDL